MKAVKSELLKSNAASVNNSMNSGKQSIKRF